MFKKLLEKIVVLIGKVHWKLKTPLTADDKQRLRMMLTPNYYIILTRRKNHLSTYFINLADFLLMGRWGYYSHALLNIEDEVKSDSDFQLIEATGAGVKLSTFDEVFNCSSVALLKPKCMSIEKWTLVFEKAKQELGKPYDNLMDIEDDSRLNCVELVRLALKNEPNYDVDFANFENMIKKYGQLSPQMFYNCPDFEVILEIKR